MVELDTRMKLRLNALIATKNAIMPGICELQVKCDRTCPLFKDEPYSCYWMDAMHAIEDIEMIVRGYGDDLRNYNNTKPGRSTKEQSRFDDII